MKCLVTADLHIFPHKKSFDRLQDCLNTLKWIFQQAEIHECDYIVIAGDLFHEKQRIDVLSYTSVFDIFQSHPNRQVYVLVGNHDMYFKDTWEVNSIKPFDALPNLHVIDKPGRIYWDKYPIDFLPYTSDPTLYLHDMQVDNPYLLFAHVAINGSVLNTVYGNLSDVVIEHDGDMQIIDKSLFQKWAKVFLGHYHAPQKLDNIVEYIGSPLQLSFGEAHQEKHIGILDLETLKTEYIINDFSPKHLIIKPEDFDSIDIKNNFVRLEVEDIQTLDLLELKNKLNAKAASFEIRPIDSSKKEDDQTTIKEASNILETQDVLEKWIKENPTALDKNRLLEFASIICQKEPE